MGEGLYARVPEAEGDATPPVGRGRGGSRGAETRRGGGGAREQRGRGHGAGWSPAAAQSSQGGAWWLVTGPARTEIRWPRPAEIEIEFWRDRNIGSRWRRGEWCARPGRLRADHGTWWPGRRGALVWSGQVATGPKRGAHETKRCSSAHSTIFHFIESLIGNHRRCPSANHLIFLSNPPLLVASPLGRSDGPVTRWAEQELILLGLGLLQSTNEANGRRSG